MNYRPDYEDKTIVKYFAIFTLVIAAIAGSGASFAQEISRLDDLVIERQWARASIGTRRPAAAYLSIRNKGTENDTLLEVSTPLSGMAEVHTMEMKNGIMKMVRIEDGIKIDAMKEHILIRGGEHIMFMGLNEPFENGKIIPVILQFENSGEVTVEVVVDQKRKDKKHSHTH